MDENRFCVYGYFENDICFYVGHGNSARPYILNKSRSAQLTDKLKSCEFQIKIMADNLTRKDAIELEQKYIKEFLEKGSKLLNIQIKRKEHKPLEYNFCKELWYISSKSKTGIKWKETRKDLSRKIIKDKDAGVVTDRGYCTTKVKGVQYSVHRIVWVLYNMQDLSPDLVVNHIDSNPKNNSPDNLIAITQSENSFLSKFLENEGRSCTGIRGVLRGEDSESWVVRWREDNKEFSKVFKDNCYESTQDALNEAMKFRCKKEEERLNRQQEIIDRVKETERLNRLKILATLGRS